MYLSRATKLPLHGTNCDCPLKQNSITETSPDLTTTKKLLQDNLLPACSKGFLSKGIIVYNSQLWSAMEVCSHLLSAIQFLGQCLLNLIHPLSHPLCHFV